MELPKFSASRLQAEERRQDAWLLKLKGYSLRQIAGKVGVSVARVQVYLKEKSRAEADRIERSAKEYRNQEIEILNELQKQYWLAWDRSQEPATKTTLRISGEPEPASGSPPAAKADTADEPANGEPVKPARTKTTERKRRDGDKGFLDGIRECIRLRSQLRGLLVANLGSLSDGSDFIVRTFHESADPSALSPPRLPPKTVVDAGPEPPEDDDYDPDRDEPEPDDGGPNAETGGQPAGDAE